MAGTISATTASLIAAAVAAGGIGVGAYESNNASIDQQAAQKANAAALLQSQQAQANQANLSKQEAVLGAQGQSQAQTGGSLTDTGTAALTDLLAGYPGYQSGGSSPSTVSGGAANPSASSAIAPTSLGTGGGNDPSSAVNAILAALRNGGAGGGPGGPGTGSISGGNWQTQPTQPQPWQELSNPVLG